MASLSESLVASIARGLNSGQIPCVLWCHYLLIAYGVPSIVGVRTPQIDQFGRAGLTISNVD